MGTTTGNTAGTLEPTATAAKQHAPTANAELPHRAVRDLPDEPLVTIQPRASLGLSDIRDLWVYRELLYFLVWRDLKVRYKQTVLGVAWVVLQPLLTTLIFTVFLGGLARVPSSRGIPYSLFVFAGLLPWTLFASAVNSSGNSLVGNAHLISKIYFPRIIIPCAAIGARLVDFAVGLAVLACLMIYYRAVVTPTLSILLLPLPVILITLFSLGIGLWVSALNVKYRDAGIILSVFTQLWMFVSPVVYPVSMIPQQWQWLYALNPLVGILESFRSSLFGQTFNWPALAVPALATLLTLLYSAFAFRRMEKSFADFV